MSLFAHRFLPEACDLYTIGALCCIFHVSVTFALQLSVCIIPLQSFNVWLVSFYIAFYLHVATYLLPYSACLAATLYTCVIIGLSTSTALNVYRLPFLYRSGDGQCLSSFAAAGVFLLPFR